MTLQGMGWSENYNLPKKLQSIGNLIPQTADDTTRHGAVWKLQSAKETTKHRQPDTTNCRWHYKAWAVWKPQSAKEITKHRQPDTTNCWWHYKAWAVWKPQSARKLQSIGNLIPQTADDTARHGLSENHNLPKKLQSIGNLIPQTADDTTRHGCLKTTICQGNYKA